MNGKILKISSNDLYGNVDDRKVAVFAAFTHVKYMNRYVIFSFLDEYNKKKLYFGSLHLKDKSIVVFSIKDNNMINVVNKFINDYINNKVEENEYQIIDISNMEKIELVSYNDMDFENLLILDKMSIKKKNDVLEENVKRGKPIILYILVLIIIGMVGWLTYSYFNPDAFKVELKKLDCTMSNYNKQVELNYESNIIVKFNKDNKFSSMEKIDIYKFNNEEEYSLFRENNRENELSTTNGGYKYDDDKLELRIISNDNLIIENYDEVFQYLKSEGYSCIEGIYNE